MRGTSVAEELFGEAEPESEKRLSDSGEFPVVRRLDPGVGVHVAEGEDRALANLVRLEHVDRTKIPPPDPYEAEASRLLDRALAQAGATKADLARALGRSDAWARKLCAETESTTIPLAAVLRLRRALPHAFAVLQRSITAMEAPAPRTAATAGEQRRVVARLFATLFAAPDGSTEARKALEDLRRALDGYEAVQRREEGR